MAWPAVDRPHLFLNLPLSSRFHTGTLLVKGAIASKIKHAIKLKTSPARLAQLLQLSLAFCFSLQPMTGVYASTPSLAAS